MLASTSLFSRAAGAAQTAMASLAEEGRNAIAAEHVRPVLHLLLSDTSELISQTATLPDGCLTVCANLKRIMDLVRLKEVEAAVRDRFGPPACRIFRLLTIKRQLEQKQVSSQPRSSGAAACVCVCVCVCVWVGVWVCGWMVR
jgi:hypothetical protein